MTTAELTPVRPPDRRSSADTSAEGDQLVVPERPDDDDFEGLEDATTQAIRRYLLALSNPDTMIDRDRIEQLELQLEGCVDPIERLSLRSRIRPMRKPRLDVLEDLFVAEAKPWGDVRGIDAESWLDEGVPPAVVKRAGYGVEPKDLLDYATGQSRSNSGRLQASLYQRPKRTRKH